MSSAMSDDALRRVLDQIQTTLSQTSRQLSLVRAQRTAKERERKGIELTRQAVEAEGSDAKVWKGVGKMSVRARQMASQRGRCD